MSDENTNNTAPDNSTRIETAVVKEEVGTAEGGKASVKETGGTSVDFDLDSGLPEDLDGEEGTGEPGAGSAEGGEGGEGGEQEADQNEPSEGDPEPLPEFDPNNAEVYDKYDARYLKEDGSLNEDAVGAEFWANFAKSEDKKEFGHLPENTYKYFEDRFAVSREFIHRIERGLVADAQKQSAAFFERVGGQERYNAALDWARKGGYSKAQRDRYNALAAKGGEEFTDAVDALMARYERANPSAARKPGPRDRRRSSPERSVTTGSAVGTGGASGGDTYASEADWQKEWGSALANYRTAKREGTAAERRAAQAEVERVRKKARRSRFTK